MGSSKKHKDRDRDREHKHKKRRRSRSRSRERDHKHKERRRKHRHGKDDSDEKRRRMSSEEPEDMGGSMQRSPSDATDRISARTAGSTGVSENQHGDGSSLSIEETNKLRAKLGLKPLSGGPDCSTEDAEASKKNEDVHVPAVNLASVKRTEDLREKMAQIKEKRRINKLLGKVKSNLGDSDSETDDAMNWIARSRKLEVEQEKARQQEKLMKEMDSEFGISNLLDEEFGRKKEYSSRDLRGLQVQHDVESFKEGSTVILTLQDKGVLDEEGEDTLVNVNMVDNEKAVKSISNKTKGADYKPYDEPEYDECGLLKHKDVLDKYDEEIDGEIMASFKLGARGRYNAAHEKRMREMRTSVQQQGQTLSLPPPVLASEFYTSSEMEGFKKVKKKVRKIRKKKMLTANDLMPLPGSSDHGDLGSREFKKCSKGAKPVNSEADAIPGLDFVEEDEYPDPENDGYGPSEDLSSVKIDDEKRGEMESVLAKTQKLRSTKKSTLSADKLLAQKVSQNTQKDEPVTEDADHNNIVLNSISEFCRALGEIPTYGMAGNRQYDDDLQEMEVPVADVRDKQDSSDEEEDQTRGWQAVEADTQAPDIVDNEPVVLQHEPVVSEGLAAALQLATQKGFLDANVEKKKVGASSKSTDLRAQNYSIEDKRYDDLDEKSRKRDRYSGGGMVQDFNEKDGYKPNVKIEYVDDNGYFMSSKEAFRYLSHRFHGKGSGKRKTEKRSKKIEMEQLMKATSSTDTPLGTATLLHEKQKAEKTPYVLLSGAGAKIPTVGALTK